MDNKETKNNKHASSQNVSIQSMAELKKTWDMSPPVIPPQDTPDWPIYLDVMKSAKDYLGSYCRNELFENFPYPQRLFTLSEMISLHVLREKGDIKHYLELNEKMLSNPDYQPNKMSLATAEMMAWLQTEMVNTKPHKSISSKSKVIISVLVFGDSYTNKMLTYTWPSMMASLPDLIKEKKVIFHIQTTQKSCDIIEKSEIAWKLKSRGVDLHYVIIPDELIEKMSSDVFTYWMLGTGASLGLHYAKKSEAAFHHSFPDFVYSDKFFSELLRLSKTHNNILGCGMRSDESILLPKLKTYEVGNELHIPADELLAHHLNSIHLCAYHYIVNNRHQLLTYPQSHVLIWEGEDMVQFNCPHVTPHWLAYGSFKDLPDRFFHTMDSELDLICKEFDYYLPQENDDLYVAEISEQGRSQFNHNFISAEYFGHHMWSAITHRDLFKFFVAGMRTKISRKIRPLHDKVFSNQQIEIEKRYVYNACQAVDKYRGLPFLRKRCHEAHIY